MTEFKQWVEEQLKKCLDYKPNNFDELDEWRKNQLHFFNVGYQFACRDFLSKINEVKNEQ